MSRPSEYPRWATGVSAVNTEPTEEHKDTGWLVKEKPPAQIFNWFMSLIYQWIVWFDSGTPSNWVPITDYFVKEPRTITVTTSIDIDGLSVIITGNVNGVIAIPLKGLKIGTIVNSIDVLVNPGGDLSFFQLYSLTGLNTATPINTQIGGNSNTTTGGVYEKVNIPAGGFTMNNDSYLYLLFFPANDIYATITLNSFRIN